jgi:hypothetical protein
MLAPIIHHAIRMFSRPSGASRFRMLIAPL